MSTDRGMDKKMWYIYIKEYYSAIKRNEGGRGKVGGREMQEGRDMGTYVYVRLIHFVIKQKLTHHCKAIILQ